MAIDPALADIIFSFSEPGLTFLRRHDGGETSWEPGLEDVALPSADDLELLHAMASTAPLRSRGLLESAVARPAQALAYADPTIHELAALLAEGIIRNHPFTDGNKRAALLAMDAVLAMNGQPIPADQERAAAMLVALAERKISVTDVGAFLSLQTATEIHSQREKP